MAGENVWQPSREAIANPWGTYASPTEDGDVDIRGELDQVLAEYGHKVFLRRATEKACDCRQDRFGNVDPDCPNCMGLGFYYKDYKILARRMLVTSRILLGSREIRTPAGAIENTEVAYFLKHTLPPRVTDMIVEVELDGKGEPLLAYRISGLWDIETVEPLRGIKGRVEFFVCFCSRGDS